MEILHHSLHGSTLPIGIDVLLPDAIGLEILAQVNLTACPADPDQRRGQMQIAVALPRRRQ